MRNLASIFLIVGLVLITLVAPPSPAHSQENWWHASWSHRIAISITESSGTNLSNYQVKVHVIRQRDMLPDYHDVMFVSGDNSGTLYFWRESFTSAQATFWVRVPFIPAGKSQTIYLYYGNPDSPPGQQHTRYLYLG